MGSGVWFRGFGETLFGAKDLGFVEDCLRLSAGLEGLRLRGGEALVCAEGSGSAG